MTEYKFQIKWHRIPKLYLIETEVHRDIIHNVNLYLDNLILDSERIDNSENLVGQIKNGQQLTLDVENQIILQFVELVKALGKEYIKRFSSEFNFEDFKQTKVTLDKIWSVHSYEGDYNPIHDHGTESNTGLSFVCWTKVPESIQLSPDKINLINASGEADGYLNLIFGDGGFRDKIHLKPPQQQAIKPVEGKLLLFPSWLLHSVNPFEGEGERRTIAGNLSVWIE